MQIDVSFGPSLNDAAARAEAAERVGFDGLWVTETEHDPFLPLVLASEHTTATTVGTSIAVAFARNPMTLATVATDLQAFSGGRFVLGLGSQIKAHITKRFSMPWSEPAERMREMIAAIRMIWATWNTGEPLNFRGRFYTHTLMTPFFSPGPNPYGPPPIYLAAVGPAMLRTAAEVADGLLIHPFTTPRYLKEVTLPAVAQALERAGRPRDEFKVSVPLFVVTGDSDADITAADGLVRRQIAFYGSTPAYRRVLELHGWGDLQTDLHMLSKRGSWDEMTKLIDDDVLDTFAAVATPAELPGTVVTRYSGLADRIALPPTALEQAWGPTVVAELRRTS